MWVDLGLIDLVAAVMNGPQTLYEMPEGSFLSQIRFTDDPDTVVPDVFPSYSVPSLPSLQTYAWIAFGTERSFGWSGFAGVGAVPGGFGPELYTYDSLTIPAVDNIDGVSFAAVGIGYGPFAATLQSEGAGISDVTSLVLSTASVGPIQASLMIENGTLGFANGGGFGSRVAAIAAWVADTHYDSPASNPGTTPGVVQNCMVHENGTLWINASATGTSGGSAPDFAGNARGSVTDGPDIIWYDTSLAPPTVGAVHVFAEIIVPVVSASPGSIYASVVKKGSVTVAVKNKGNIVANVIQ